MIAQFVTNIGNWIQSMNPFSDVDLTILYDWLPLDIANAVGLVVALCVILFCIGILKKVLSW